MPLALAGTPSIRSALYFDIKIHYIHCKIYLLAINIKYTLNLGIFFCSLERFTNLFAHTLEKNTLFIYSDYVHFTKQK